MTYSAAEIRNKFLKFFEGKGHTIVASSSLLPENDSSVLFTTAGMQQFKPYYTGEKNAHKDFGSKSTVTVQKCIRTSDIDEVGDDSHLTFFEMLGNFSFDGYSKEDAIRFAHEFITKEMGLTISYVTVFGGLEGGTVPKDEESRSVWQGIGISDVREEGMNDVFWGPTGKEGPCGPTTEIYCKNSKDKDIEIWNIVFNQFYCHGSREQLLADPGSIKLEPLPFKGIDTGMGLERLAMISAGVSNVFETDLFQPIMDKITDMSSRKNPESVRIVADHMRAAIFLISDGVVPSNSDRGYILRRLIRKAVFHIGNNKISETDISSLFDTISNVYRSAYPKVIDDGEYIKKILIEEINRFIQTLEQGRKEFGKLAGGNISGADAFKLFSSYGLPIDMTIALAGDKGLEVDRNGFEIEFNKHQEISRVGADKKFKGGLEDANDPMVVRYHTATHLLHQALHDVLGDGASQKGSNITPDRLRFDFAYDVKMTDEEKRRVEDMVNEKISAALPMNQVTLPKAEAEKTGARHFFGEKYGDDISIYFIGNTLEDAYSKEFCGGPHVKNTSELAGPEGKWKFKIAKEEAVARGIRRIKAVLE